MNAKHQAAYDEALEAFRAAAAKHRVVTIDYRARRVGDAEFLASLATVNAASAAVDQAEAPLLPGNRR